MKCAPALLGLLCRPPVLAECLVPHEERVVRSLGGEPDDLDIGRGWSFFNAIPQVGDHPPEPPGLLVSVGQQERNGVVQPGQAPAAGRQRPASVALGEYRDCRALSPVKQRRADRASAIRRMDAAGLPHLVNGIGDTAGGQDAVADHDGTVVHRDRAAGEVNPGIGELLEQVLLAQVLVLMVDGLDGRDQARPGRHLPGIDRAASRGRYLRSPARLWTTSGAAAKDLSGRQPARGRSAGIRSARGRWPVGGSWGWRELGVAGVVVTDVIYVVAGAALGCGSRGSQPQAASLARVMLAESAPTSTKIDEPPVAPHSASAASTIAAAV